FAARDDGDAWPREGNDERSRPRGRDGDVRADAARRDLAPQRVADGLRRSDQPLEAADVDRDEIGTVTFEPRRELAGDLCERRRGTGRLLARRRTMEAGVQRGIGEWGLGINRDWGLGIGGHLTSRRR